MPTGMWTGELVWEAVTQEIPRLRPELARLLDREKPDGVFAPRLTLPINLHVREPLPR